MWNLWFYNSAGEWEYAGNYTQHQAFEGALTALAEFPRASTFTPGAQSSSEESELGMNANMQLSIGLSLWAAKEVPIRDGDAT